MLIDRKEKIVENIKYLCETGEIDVNFDEIQINYVVDITNSLIYRNQGKIRCSIKITNTKEDFVYYLEDEPALESTIIAYGALRGYVMYKKSFYQALEEEKLKEDYKKKHPILIRIKEYFGGF